MFDQIYQKIDELLNNKEKVVIAIDGQSASGKTTLAKQLSNHYHAPIIHMDDFFLTLEQRTKERLSEIGGNIDYERFEDEVLNHIKDLIIYMRPYDCQSFTFKDSQKIEFNQILIIEGAYSLRLPWQNLYDLKIVLTIDEVLQKERIQLRNPKLIDRFINEWIPKENLYISHHEVLKNADIHVHIEK